MIPQALGFFGWKRPQVAAIDWTHTPGEDLTPEEWAGSENPRDIRQ